MVTRSLTASPLLAESEERQDLRESVAKLVGRYGRLYFQQAIRSGDGPVELWRGLGDAGFLGAHISEEYGGGGAGMVETAIVIEETAALGCPLQMIVISPTICG